MPILHQTNIVVDDSSGETIELVATKDEHKKMVPDQEYEEKQARLWKRRPKAGIIEVGSLIKVKGEIQEKWSVRKIHVMKLGTLIKKTKLNADIVTDQNIETKAWEERVAFKRSVLSKSWKIPSSILSKRRKPMAPSDLPNKDLPTKTKPETKSVDFRNLPRAAHSIRNLKLQILPHINTLQRFTAADLLTQEDIQFAATCVANHDFPKGITGRNVAATLLAALNLLLRDGNIIIPRSKQHHTGIDVMASSTSIDETFIVVGKWNLGSTIKSAAKDGKIVVKDLWRKIVNWGNGWEGTTKGVIGVVVEEVLTEVEDEEWIESKSGVWTRL
jgi:hypothetical protein